MQIQNYHKLKQLMNFAQDCGKMNVSREHFILNNNQEVTDILLTYLLVLVRRILNI